MRILILGGAGLTGPHQIRYALARGHSVTLFNRGRTLLPADLAGVEVLHGDRAAGELRALQGRRWDVCIDNPTTLPAWARDAAQQLAGSVDRFIFISTISVYADMRLPVTEDAPLLPYLGLDRYAETIDSVRASGFRLYGPLKACSEHEILRQFPGRAAIVRPGLIVGPGDASDRFTSWLLRVRRGGEVLAPGTGRDPVQVIDARDLAEWTIRLAEQGTTGVFNAAGPAQPLAFAALLETIRGALDAAATFTWIPASFLAAQQVAPWSDLPAWMPGDGDAAGMMRADIGRALAAGLGFRPLVQTVRDTLAWFDALPAPRRAAVRAGLAPEREQAVLAAWRAARQGVA
ncbi:NAD-dependent epimerase/dehydratase family protein [Ramlibacter sp.]|uniref:NAD-dependent epimerase/dehydratase family protein n=1 Tax=Ramlibacter sp. TaxID=1917967 RepID=UPI002BEDC0BA|nr:NAD-dependent epimerase/dehydratase family protein [Ramlibacter sp.]HWI82152.1 NAD-dependent epimerase/dehydratase family protein [Ramlibacter sp.]